MPPLHWGGELKSIVSLCIWWLLYTENVACICGDGTIFMPCKRQVLIMEFFCEALFFLSQDITPTDAFETSSSLSINWHEFSMLQVQLINS